MVSLLSVFGFAFMAVLDTTALFIGYGLGRRLVSRLTVLKVNVIGFCSLAFSLTCIAFDSEYLQFSFLVSSFLLGMMFASFWRAWNE